MATTQTLFNQQSCSNNDHRSQITNYCASIDCLKPLCPECIQEHYQYHVQTKTPAAIQSILITRTNCEKKIAKAIESLQKEIEQYDVQYIFNPDEILNQEISKMQEAKQQMYEIIELFFHEQQNFLQTKVKENTLKVKNISGIFQKISDVVQQLDLLKNSIVSSQDPFQYFNKACRLDVKSLLDRYKSDLKKTIQSRQLDPINVHIDEHNLFNLKKELSKIVVVMAHSHEDSVDNISVVSKDRDKSINYGYQNNEIQQPRHQQSQKPITPALSNPGDQDDVNFNQTAINSEFSIIRPNYFTGNSKFLHFFQNGENILKLCNLESMQWTVVQSDYQASTFHKSIATPNGDIYISGGQVDQNRKDSIIRKCSIQGKVQSVGQLNYARSSHSMVYCNNSIYFIGGYMEQRKMTQSVEKFILNTQKVEICAPCTKPANSPACCSFNDRYIYKFGGNDENGQILLMIERYDTFNNKWEMVDPQITSEELAKFTNIYQCASCCQINQNNIYVYGGYDNDDKGVAYTFLLQVDQDKHSIHQVNTKQLPFPEGFWNNQAIIHNRKLYVLQNIEVEQNVIDEENRALFCFDGRDWNELQYQLNF